MEFQRGNVVQITTKKIKKIGVVTITNLLGVGVAVQFDDKHVAFFGSQIKHLQLVHPSL